MRPFPAPNGLDGPQSDLWPHLQMSSCLLGPFAFLACVRWLDCSALRGSSSRALGFPAGNKCGAVAKEFLQHSTNLTGEHREEKSYACLSWPCEYPRLPTARHSTISRVDKYPVALNSIDGNEDLVRSPSSSSVKQGENKMEAAIHSNSARESMF